MMRHSLMRSLIALTLAVILLVGPSMSEVDASRVSARLERMRRESQAQLDELILQTAESDLPSEATILMELESELSMEDPALFHDAANGESYLRAPYLPATVNGPMYPRSGPQSGAAKGWLEQAAQPAWSALPFGPRTPSGPYILPFDHMREVHDEFSWNYDVNNPAPPPQFSFAAPIFLEQQEQHHTTTVAEAETESENEAETETEADSDSESETETEVESEEPVEYVQALEVESLEDEVDTPALLEAAESESMTLTAPKQLIPDSFWVSRGNSPSFNSYTNPYHDLTHPALVGSNQDLITRFRSMNQIPVQAVGQTGWFDRVRTGFVPQPHAYAYHQGALPPFAHEIEPFQHMANVSPNVINIGENEVESFTSSSFVEANSEGCQQCQYSN